MFSSKSEKTCFYHNFFRIKFKKRILNQENTNIVFGQTQLWNCLEFDL